MGLTEKYKKRVLIFVFIPILIAITFLTDDLLLRIISAVILAIYAGFIIFLRDSGKNAEIEKLVEDDNIINDSHSDYDYQKVIPDEGEEFKIISPNKNLEVITADDFTPSIVKNNREFFKFFANSKTKI